MGEDKDNMIRGVYYDLDSGFGSINATYKQAHRILNTITLNDVKVCLSRQKLRQTNIIGDLTVMWQKHHYKNCK